MKNKRILLTGGAGFIGTKIAEKYYLENEIIIYDSFRRNSLMHSSQLNHENVTVVKGDILDTALLQETFERYRPTHVIHLAAIAGIDNVISHPVDTLRINVLGTVNVLDIALKYADEIERFVDISTSEVFGSYSYKSEETSNTNLAPVGEARWTYSISKLIGEHFVHAYQKEFGLKTVSIRPFNIYGPGQVGEGAIHQFAIRAIRDEEIQIHGDGDQIRSWCYIDDFIEGLCLCLEHTEAVGKTFNIGNPRGTVTISMLASLIVDISKSKSSINYVPKHYADVELRIPNIERAKEVLAYQPKVELQEGLARTIEWYKQNEKH